MKPQHQVPASPLPRPQALGVTTAETNLVLFCFLLATTAKVCQDSESLWVPTLLPESKKED